MNFKEIRSSTKPEMKIQLSWEHQLLRWAPSYPTLTSPKSTNFLNSNIPPNKLWSSETKQNSAFYLDTTNILEICLQASSSKYSSNSMNNYEEGIELHTWIPGIFFPPWTKRETKTKSKQTKRGSFVVDLKWMVLWDRRVNLAGSMVTSEECISARSCSVQRTGCD